MRLPGAPRPPHSSLDLSRSPTTDADVNAMRDAAWHRLGVVALPVDDITEVIDSRRCGCSMAIDWTIIPPIDTPIT